jgi:hypothetical protein
MTHAATMRQAADISADLHDEALLASFRHPSACQWGQPVHDLFAKLAEALGYDVIDRNSKDEAE